MPLLKFFILVSKKPVLFFLESFFIPAHTDSKKSEQEINLNPEGLKLVI